MDTHVQADNNFRANSFTYNGSIERLRGKRCGAISIETGDKFHDDDPGLVKSWSDLGQRQPLEDLLVEVCRTENTPAVKCTGPFEAGIGYHAMWDFNELGAGDGTYGHITDDQHRNIRLNNPWTNTVAKICPGPGPGVTGGKIGEFDDLLAAVRRRLSTGVASRDAKGAGGLRGHGRVAQRRARRQVALPGRIRRPGQRQRLRHGRRVQPNSSTDHPSPPST